MNQPNLPGGLDKEGKTLEIYISENQLMVDYKGARIDFWQLPEHLIQVFRREMHTMKFIVKKHNLQFIENEDIRLEAYVGITYGKVFDNTPDYEEGKGTHPEIDELDSSKFYGISYREREILKHISEGLTDSDIAARAFISPFTVQNHRHNILAKTGCRNAAELTRFAIENNIIQV